MAVPTWKSQAAPSFEAPLKTIADWGNDVDEKSVSDRDSDVVDL